MQNPKTISSNNLTYVSIDLDAIKHNLAEIRRLGWQNKFFLPTRQKIRKEVTHTQILPVVKADAYGHGMEHVAKLLQKEGVGYFGVSDVAEGVALRQWGIKKPILLFECTLPQFAKEVVDFDLMPSVCTMELALALNEYARRQNKSASIHINIDTGMGRLGVWKNQAYDFIKRVHALSHIRIYGIYTHFPSADDDPIFTRLQITTLYDLVRQLDKEGLVIPYIHAANSMGLAGYKSHVLNLARPGLMLYGLYPHPKLKRAVNLKPAMSVHSKIIFLKKIQQGRSISYGRTFRVARDMTVATIPIGYNDGYARGFSNKAFMIVDGIRCPVLGRVTMDQTIIDVSKVKRPTLGMSVTVLGRQGKIAVTADDLAACLNTINYEIVCNLGNRLPRVYR